MISRQQLVARLKEAGFHFSRKTDRSVIYKRRNSPDRVNTRNKKSFSEADVRSTLSQAGLAREQIDAFLRHVVDS